MLAKKEMMSMLDDSLYRDALSRFMPSEDMRAHLEANPIFDMELIELVLGSPTALTEKRDYFAEARKTCSHEQNELQDALRTHHDEIAAALNELDHVGENEFLYRKTMWDEQPVLFEWHEAGIAPFSDLESLLVDLREEMLEEEWDEDSGCWNVVEKWRRNDDKSWSNTYRFYFIRDEAVFFDKPELEQSLKRARQDDRHVRAYRGSPYGLDLPTPLDVGDIITLDCRPFMPLKYGLVLVCEDDDHRDAIYPQVLSGIAGGPFDGTWSESALKTGSGFEICPPGYSLLYNARRVIGMLPADFDVLGCLQYIVEQDRNQVKEIEGLADHLVSTADLDEYIRKETRRLRNKQHKNGFEES